MKYWRRTVHQEPLVTKKEIRSPVVALFAAVYVFAIVLAARSDHVQTLIYIGLSVGILLLAWLVVGLTERFQVSEVPVKTPWLELAFGCLVFLLYEFLRFPRVEFGLKWSVPSIIQKELWLFVLPCVFLLFRGYRLSSLGLSPFRWGRNARIGGLVFACMAVPSAFLVGDTARLVLNGTITVGVAIPGFFILFFHNVALSGLPEEFFFRGYVQTRLAAVFGSKLGGVLSTSLLFGLIHIDDLMRLYPEMSLSEAFASAFFLHCFIGLIFGILWERTRSLIPGILVHSGINALNNLGSIKSLLVL